MSKPKVTHTYCINNTVRHLYVLDDKPTSFVQVDKDGEVYVRGRFTNEEIAAVAEAMIFVTEKRFI